MGAVGAVNHATPWYLIRIFYFAQRLTAVQFSFFFRQCTVFRNIFYPPAHSQTHAHTYTHSCGSRIHLQFLLYLLLCCFPVSLPSPSVFAVHWLLRIDSSASWLCIMRLSSPHVSRRICQLSSYDLSCTCLNSTLWSRNMKGSLQRAASLTSDELVSFSSASVLEFQMYIPSVQIESLALLVGV